jgi:hypothetical protein
MGILPGSLLGPFLISCCLQAQFQYWVAKPLGLFASVLQLLLSLLGGLHAGFIVFKKMNKPITRAVSRYFSNKNEGSCGLELATRFVKFAENADVRSEAYEELASRLALRVVLFSVYLAALCVIVRAILPQ